MMLAVIVWGYWWLTVALAILLLFIFPNYYEILLWGVIYDALYGLPLHEYWGIAYIFSIGSIVLFLLSLFLRKMLSAYESTI
jgi:hypothetical protein